MNVGPDCAWSDLLESTTWECLKLKHAMQLDATLDCIGWLKFGLQLQFSAAIAGWIKHEAGTAHHN